MAPAPSHAAAQQADEERAAGADFIESELEGFIAGALFPSNAPAQVHLDQFDLPLAAEPAQFGPGVRHQLIALPHHVAERRGNEDADAAVGRLGHSLFVSSNELPT